MNRKSIVNRQYVEPTGRSDSSGNREPSQRASESEELLRAITEQSLIGNYIIQDRIFQFINSVAASYTDYESKEIMGKYADFLVHPDDLKAAKRNVFVMLKEQRKAHQEFRIVTKKGEVRWIKEIVSSIPYNGRRAILGTVIDITEQKMAEEALQESQRRFGDLIEFLPDATFAIDLEGKLIAWNRAAEEITDIKAQDILGKKGYEHARPFWKQRRPMTIDLVLKSNKKYENTYTVFSRKRNLAIVETYVPGIQIQGKDAYLWGKASPLYDNKGNVMGAIEVIRDITQHKLAEESLLTREHQLEIKSHELAELNTALKVLLNQREKDKTDLEERLMVTVEELVYPYVNELKTRQMDSTGKSYVNILEANLRNILSPFASKMSSKYLKLTNREVRIVNLIKEGWSSKEIADLLNVSPSSINIYRYRIRKKLGLKKEENLTTFLQSLSN